MKFLPLRAEIKAAAEEVQVLCTKTYFPLSDSTLEFNDPGGICRIDGETITCKLVDLNAAVAAASVLNRYQQVRTELKYRLAEFGPSEDSIEIHRADSEYNQYVRIHIDDYVPSEVIDLIGEVLWAAAYYCVISCELVSSLTSFSETFASFDVLSISIPGNSKTPDARDIISLHKSELKLARLVVAAALDHKPINIEVDGTVKHLSVSIDSRPIRLSPSQIRGVAALALLEYDHWFFLDEFRKLAFPDDAYEPRKQFDAALSVLKQFSPFGWDTDEGLRRITGAVIRSAVDRAVLQAYLKQKKAS